MNFAQALRLSPNLASGRIVCLVGAGGKTTALFQIAQDLIENNSPAVFVTATSHLGAWQASKADRHIIAKDVRELTMAFEEGLRGKILFTGEVSEDRILPIDLLMLNWLREKSMVRDILILIESDGSRNHPLKAPAPHEPPIPEFADIVIVVAGLSAIGKPLDDRHVHRPEIFSQLAGVPLGQAITQESITRVLNHAQAGQKNIPPSARRIAFLNQADTPELKSIGGSMARELLTQFDSVIVGSLKEGNFQTFEHTAGIILAAGEATRFGSPKQLLNWRGKPFVRHIAETALRASLWPVTIITGAFAAEVESALTGLPVKIVLNSEYRQGQSASIRKGIESLPSNTGSAIFLLADQPQIPAEVIRALTEVHARELPAILAPLVLEERRANPVLFDKAVFPDLMKLTGDIGGRAIFPNYKVEYLPWHDDRLLLDVDKPEDYQRLVEDETL